ncbi:NAD-dependent epimerase/dehydratase family protein [Kaistia geumhonensis]|uniref:UDP-glucuronate 4-epimerase n=1 Tax=Kaistia geumhonensis TaxID=410839 RepID=A0ABU0M150_9HYPH|nr:NAD-dependent epimerase/dehydratase family protein [Kaistia geumhonensis]MCX5480103.1 NAD-dependent epimerase/dehydratase family protein [Kaistia geumhonensis]MDQ0514668.1 UDP-glucuronate 4-epimerase [Kaistia geumhonensis]
MNVLITGTAGFIGFHVARRMLAEGHRVVGFDAFTPYYDPTLKRARNQILEQSPLFTSVEAQLENRDELARTFDVAEPEIVIHLAAQAGVRYALEDPEAYVSSNVVGSHNLLELARAARPRHLMLASTSSVYGGNEKQPFREIDPADHPLSLYAATKKSMEAMSHSYAHLFDLPTTCFRFFTVYGPWGRPDMALFKFVAAGLAGEPIQLFGNGQMQRDFTYVEDLVTAITALSEKPPVKGKRLGPHDSLSPVAPWRTVNIGGGNPVQLLEFVRVIAETLGVEIDMEPMAMQPGDMRSTHADASLLAGLIGPMQFTPIANGVRAFVDWYRSFYGSVD